MKFLLFTMFLSLLPLKALAEEPSFGLAAGNSWGATIGSYNLFDQDKVHWGMKRYGGGVSRMQVGNGLGLNLQSSGGVFLNDAEDPSFIEPKLTIEPGSGRLVLNTNGSVESSYQWLPMVGTGPQFNLFGNQLFVVARAGGSVGNFGNDGIVPRFHNAFGYGVYFDNHVAFTYTVIGDARIEAAEVENNHFVLHLEQTRGQRDEKSYVFMWRGLF